MVCNVNGKTMDKKNVKTPKLKANTFMNPLAISKQLF